MDFQSLSRRELQVLCKKNKIPANLTNVAMVDSLKALEIVEGMDELAQMCESERGVRLEVASPCVPPTGGRSTRMKNAGTRAATGTNDALLTPAPSGVMSRRRVMAKEDSVVKQVCGTRRSARLAEKSARLLKGVRNEKPDLLKKGLFAEDWDESKVYLKESQDGLDESKVNLKESQDGLDEISGVTDVSEGINLEDDSERKDEEQVDLAEEQGIGTEVDLVKNNHSRFNEGGDGSENPDLPDVEAISIVVEDEGEVPCEKDVSTEVEEEISYHSEADGAKPELEGSGDGFFDVQASETDIEVKMTQEDEDIIESEGTVDDEASEGLDTVSEDKIVVQSDDGDAISEVPSNSDVFIDEDAYHEEYIDLDVKPNNDDDSSETESEYESESVILEAMEESSKSNDSFAAMPSDIDETRAFSGDENENNFLIYEDLPLPSNDPTEGVVENRLPIIMNNFPTESLFVAHQIQPSYSTPVRASVRKNRVMSASSDNKENMGTETKTRNTMLKEITRTICKMDDENVSELSKKLKEKVYITTKLDKREWE